MGRVIKTILRAIFRPDKNGQLLESQLSSGLWTRTFIGLILFGLLFSLTSIFQAFSGNVPAIPLILPFSLENYFVWQAVFVYPLACFELAAGELADQSHLQIKRG